MATEAEAATELAVGLRLQVPGVKNASANPDLLYFKAIKVRFNYDALAKKF
jgi:hypothetical protein